MKNLLKITIILILIFLTFWTYWWVNAWSIDLDSVNWSENITNHSIVNIANSSTWDISNDAKDLWFKVLTLIKYIVLWLLVILLVYAGIQMIMSMWSDEDKLSNSKRQLRYTLIWLVFINIPWSLYDIFAKNSYSTINEGINWTWSSENNNNLLINTDLFDETINWWIVLFIEAGMWAIAIFIIIVQGINIMISRWREEKIKEAREKITWSLIWLVFIWFIEAWKRVVYTWNISDWASLFNTMENLVLFFAWPIAIAFLTLAWYYYITANWEEDRIKKAKSIIVNTVIATVILLASHAILKDLITL
jgi:hypothetical protein